MIAEPDLQKKIKNVLVTLDHEKQGYIYKTDDETIDRMFKDWKPSEIIHYLDDMDLLNAEYIVHDDTYGWQTRANARDAVVKYVNIYDLAVAIRSKCIRCGVPEIDRLMHKTER